MKEYTILQNQETVEFLAHLTEAIDEVKEYLGPKRVQFSQYQSMVLVEILEQLKVLENSTSAESLGLTGESIRQRWKALAAFGVSLVEQCLQSRSSIVSPALFDSLMRASLKQTEEKSQIDRIAQLILADRDDQSIAHEMFALYHQLFDGRYKILLAFYRFLYELRQDGKLQLR